MKLNAKAVLGIAVSILLLWWTLRDVPFQEVLHHVRAADPLLFLVAVALATSGLAVRALRWKLLLLPVARGVPFRPRYAATSIGFAANNLLPARVGEFARALSLSKLTGLPVGGVFGSLAVERVFDGIALVLLLFVSLAGAVPVDPEVAAGLAAVGVAGTAVMAGVVGLLAFAPERSLAFAERVLKRLPTSLGRPVLDGMRAFVGALGMLRSPRLLLLSLLWGLGQWAFLALSYLVALRAFGIVEVSYLGAVFIQSLVSFGVALPSSPGFFGPFEAVIKLALGLWGIPPGRAIAFAMGFHIGGFIPITLIGIWYVWRLNLRWSEVEGSEEVVEESVEHGPDAAPDPPLEEGSRA